MDADRIKRLEGRALVIAMGASLVMGVAGVATALLANSTAILTDGLFSLIGFAAAFLGRRVSRKADAPPDRIRPVGYAADEALFSTFRALSLLGLVMFASLAAVMSISAYAAGGPAPELNVAPLAVYFPFIAAVCGALWGLHRWTWARTGRRSEVLRLEASAAAMDGLMTLGAGVALGAIYWGGDGVLAPVAPVGDSVVVLLLCLALAGQYRRELMAGMGELAGVTARPEAVAAARRAVRPAVREDGGAVVDLSVLKMGRTHLATVYYDPGRAVRAAEVDALNLRMIRDVRAALPGADVLLFVTEQPRRWPEAMSPY